MIFEAMTMSIGCTSANALRLAVSVSLKAHPNEAFPIKIVRS